MAWGWYNSGKKLCLEHEVHYVTAGESNNATLMAIVEDVPAGLCVRENAIDADLGRWAGCLGCDDLPRDAVRVLSGMSNGRTTGAPVALALDNAAHAAALGAFCAEERSMAAVPRPGTADIAAALKTDADACLPLARRAALRSDVMRVAAAGIAREFLADLGVEIHSYTVRIGEASMREEPEAFERFAYTPLDVETSAVRCPSPAATRLMEAAIEDARATGDTLGGEFALVVSGVVAGLGDFAAAPRGLSARLAQAVFSAPSVVGVEMGCASAASRMTGAHALDAIVCDAGRGFSRATNRAGGVEGGVSTGMPIVLRATVAPSPAFGREAPSISMDTLDAADRPSEAYHPCAVPSVAVSAEAEVAFVLAEAYRAKFGGDAMSDIHAALKAYNKRLRLAAR